MEPNAAKELEAEIELLKRVSQGDQRSFGELYDRFASVLFSTAYRMLKNQEAAEDVLQDVFIQIWRKAPLYDPARGRPLTWAVTLTRNKAIDTLRSTQLPAGSRPAGFGTIRTIRRQKLFRLGHISGDEQACARGDSKAFETTARRN